MFLKTDFSVHLQVDNTLSTMLLASLGLLRTSIASSSSVRSFSSSPVIGLLKSHSGAKKRFRATGSGLVSLTILQVADGSGNAYVYLL